MEQIISVSQINRYIKLKFEHDVKLNDVFVCGEISNFTNHIKSGHFYFSLKDNDSVIKAVMFKQNALKATFLPKDGQKVMVRGQVSVYERDGSYQIYVNQIIPDGEGNLSLQFEMLKERFQKEGLFDEKHKKQIPRFPEKIGVITSQTGAAIQDIVNVIKRRYPCCELVLYPAIVQGESAATTLISGIKYFNQKNNRVDTILLGRGGGSIEDLWCFNDEKLAYAIFNSETPIISCVGHETDFTISDYVSDLRAPTPSAAAELAVPDEKSIKMRCLENSNKIEKILSDKIEFLNKNLLLLSERPCLKNKDYYIESRKEKLNQILNRPIFKNPNIIIEKNASELKNKKSLINLLADKNHNNYKMLLSSKAAKLDALSPLKVLSRGYAVVTRDDTPVTAQKIKKDDIVSINFIDGIVKSKVIEKGDSNV